MTGRARTIAEVDVDRLMTLRETAEYTGLSELTLKMLRQLAVGPRPTRLGRRYLYRRSVVDGWRGRGDTRTELKAALICVTDAILDVAEVFDQIV